MASPEAWVQGEPPPHPPGPARIPASGTDISTHLTGEPGRWDCISLVERPCLTSPGVRARPGGGSRGGSPWAHASGVDVPATVISVHECRGSPVASTGVQGGPPRLPPPGPYGDADAPGGRPRRVENRGAAN